MEPQAQTSSVGSLDPQAVALAKAIRQSESGGDFNAKGASGEHGAYQFMDSTWDKTSSKYGIKVPLKSATPEQQNEVAYKQIKEWKDKGFNPGQIASMWNAGEGEPDAYLGKFSNGQPSSGKNKKGVSFDVPKYAKSVASAYQTIKGGGYVNADPQNPSSTAAPQEQEGFLPSIFRSLTQPVATLLARPIQAGAELLGVPDYKVNEISAKVPFYGKNNALDVPTGGSDVLKDVGRAAQTISLGLPVGSMSKSLGVGALAGAGSGLEKDPSLKGVVRGGLVGTAFGGVGGGISKLFEKLPKTLTDSAFKGLSPKQVEKVLAEKSIGTKEGLLAQSEKAISQYGKDIDHILLNTKEKGAGDFAIRATQQSFPEFSGKVGTDKLLKKVGSLIPSGPSGFEGLDWNRGTILSYLEKIANGTATLQEKNKVRSAIDSATKGGYAKLAKSLNPSAGHDLAMSFADALRKEVQGSEKATIPVFEEFTKEMGIKSVLRKVTQKSSGGLIRWRDIVPFMAGSGLGGLPGGLMGVAAERIAENPAAQFTAAKAIKGLSSFVNPALGRAGLLSPVVNKR